MGTKRKLVAESQETRWEAEDNGGGGGKMMNAGSKSICSNTRPWILQDWVQTRESYKIEYRLMRTKTKLVTELTIKNETIKNETAPAEDLI